MTTTAFMRKSQVEALTISIMAEEPPYDYMDWGVAAARRCIARSLRNLRIDRGARFARAVQLQLRRQESMGDEQLRRIWETYNV